MQIAHNGRNSHSSLRPDGSVPVAPSAILGNIPALTRDFQHVQAEIPRALEASEIPAIVGTFRQAALNAIEAGVDGVNSREPIATSLNSSWKTEPTHALMVQCINSREAVISIL
jgi:hypothetical protein